MSLEALFQEAAAISKTLSEKPDNETLLKLYSLFKQGSEGDTQESGPSNPFDFVAKFKHEAWAKLQGMSKEDAMQQYIDLVKQLKG
ncbi:MAG: acyl-CoA-binding protein [Bacteroidetes bacterium 24-39-8]|jgi:acyl-CoA-binding protein|nr:MAG: acyl-CoA-binding protein [Sphingobacteriia bacterium 35-40-8]OYZ48991.1 MAG: acyl-CoA-binding protein [Bacteroidetes bacterium 24-39-8]OZA61883.1 MAG: acyl-CoA-binding protein [Sphingobacteriia bacterium 39-39-8]HQR94256.1 acyl-CoA-binding protein [Sediminibacterium sp.]HQS54721.1 acyl-CoA-binding protein [Sediminibacterium sp.]